jgi:hypothetical protein
LGLDTGPGGLEIRPTSFDLTTVDRPRTTGAFVNFDDFQREQMFRRLWESVRIERAVPYSLFTFGDSELPYFLVLGSRTPGDTVEVRQGEIKITRPLIVTADDDRPEFRNFFESADESSSAGLVEFLLARTAGFSHLRFDNTSGPAKIVTDTVEEAVEQLGERLDREEEDRVAVLSAPPKMAGVALVKYATQRVVESAPDNVQELRERGFLP